ncbi:MAG: FAD-dependent oxidoreductase [Armatimonadota bacterium]|nr:FAD-dependent oxidoreductase [Armatimonadota bacterium]MDR7486734.1 FAD-dependent oxidoreductase [Armatimonadota bacterium]MDR7534286.1 FAD-dependent oxidoreductase [Armatimonadota bacterium]MDR7535363.1 FAD-dependent oxidoreductase [Armatimonadota bacterium]
MVRIIGTWDVVVAGSGSAGLVAAVAAAREGARTLLVERYGFLGGNLTAGMLGNFLTFHNMRGEQIVGGIPQEIVDRLMARGGSPGHLRNAYGNAYSVTPYDTEAMKAVALEITQEAGVELLLHTFITDTLVEDRRVRGLQVANKSGLQLILGRTVVDASGDGDVAALAGAAFEKGRPEDGATMAMTLMFRVANVDTDRVAEEVRQRPGQFILAEDPYIGKSREEVAAGIRSLHDAPLLTGWFDLVAMAKRRGEFHPNRQRVVISLSPRPGEVYVNSTAVVRYDGTDARQLTAAEVEARRQVDVVFTFLRRYVAGFEQAVLAEVAPGIGVRETRRILGEYVLTLEDVLEGRTFPDGVAKGAYAVDVHEPDGTIWHKHVKDGRAYDIPYRCLVPRDVDGLLVAGRCISVSREALGSTRVTAQTMAVGQAAGTAAALAAKEGIEPRRIPAGVLRTTLAARGAIV